MAGLSTFQIGPKGLKRVRNGQPRCFWPFGTLLGPSGPFYKDYFKQKMIFCSKTPPPHSTLSLWGNKLIFVWNGSKVSRWTQRGPKLSKTSRFSISDPFGPLWTTLECWQACHVWPFLFVLLVRFLLGHPVFLEHYFGSFIISYFQFIVMVEYHRMSQMQIILWMTNPVRQKKANWCFPACVLR